MSGFQQDLVRNLPDSFAKTKASNNAKLFAIEEEQMSLLRQDITAVEDMLDINNVTGKTLDLYGEMIAQSRGKAKDSQYLYMIKSKIMRNLAGGDYTSIAKAVCMTFDCQPEQFLLEESETPCVVTVIVLPLAVIAKAELSPTQALTMIGKMLPVGIRVEGFLFEGTFCFSEREDEYDENAGFTDIEGGILGGYLGFLYGENEEGILPID